MADKTELVEEIKSLQRSDPEAKQAWWDFCSNELGGIKDPNKHDAATLLRFLNTFGEDSQELGSSSQNRATRKGGGDGGRSYRGGSGGGGTFRGGGESDDVDDGDSTSRGGWPSNGVSGGGAYAHGESSGKGGSYARVGDGGGGGGRNNHSDPDPELVEFVKCGQRQSAHWKAAWHSYCDSQGGGFKDPARHEESFVLGFIEYVGQCVLAQLSAIDNEESNQSNQSNHRGGGTFGRPVGSFVGGSPGGGKRVNPVGTGGGGGCVGGSGGRWSSGTGTGTGGQWVCSGNVGGRWSPASVGGGASGRGKGCAKGNSSIVAAVPSKKRSTSEMSVVPRAAIAPTSSKRTRMSSATEDPEKTELIRRVKNFQRRDEESKQSWWSYTDEHHGGIHDPARLDAAVLEAFLFQYEDGQE
eukprot:TRINITY_DN50781_c0_g1_i1.p1 TRINITY_DN50781_c0_g1~~TRINITY_DN50781_c0_g1_i1.p1  ORF type:complete len:437 (-),score=86.61 TRINITY_DN50781_c0_g1_i1:113-1348(-)